MINIETNELSPFIKSEKELENAHEAFAIGNHGKARVCARRAIGYVTEFYLEQHEELLPLYGKSFMNNLRGIINDKNIPSEIRELAQKLIARPEFDEITGNEAIEYAEKIIEYFKKKIVQ